MKLHNVTQINEFMDAINKCKGDVWLESVYGDRYSLKSKLTQYLAIAELIGESADDLELFCADPNDEAKFFEFFKRNPDVLGDKNGSSKS